MFNYMELFIIEKLNLNFKYTLMITSIDLSPVNTPSFIKRMISRNTGPGLLLVWKGGMRGDLHSVTQANSQQGQIQHYIIRFRNPTDTKT